MKLSYKFYTQINFSMNKRLARLLDISYEGAGIELINNGRLPDNNSETKLQLLLPGYAKPISFPAKVVWIMKSVNATTSPSITMGLQFMDIDKKTRERLCGFIWGNPR